MTSAGPPISWLAIIGFQFHIFSIQFWSNNEKVSRVPKTYVMHGSQVMISSRGLRGISFLKGFHGFIMERSHSPWKIPMKSSFTGISYTQTIGLKIDGSEKIEADE